MSKTNPRPDDSFERRFALEQAVAFAGTSTFTASVGIPPSATAVAVAHRFLEFLKGEDQ